MENDELRQLLERMRNAGLDPLRCDTPIPAVDVPVMAGYPAEVDDSVLENYVLVPRKLLGSSPRFMVDAKGLSMLDAGINTGDRLEVEIESNIADGDIVIADIDGAFTVKTFFIDDSGEKWLVPQNDEYDAIPLNGGLWRIVGKVIAVRKGLPRTSYNKCAKAVMRTIQKTAEKDMECGMSANNSKGRGHTARNNADKPMNIVFKLFHNRQRIDYDTIRKKVEEVIVKQMRHRYEWYAAYRVFMDLNLLEDVQLTKFAQQMTLWFPDFPLKCTADAIRDYAVGHTAKNFTLWTPSAFRQDQRRGQLINGFTTLFHRCEELRAVLYPLPVTSTALPF